MIRLIFVDVVVVVLVRVWRSMNVRIYDSLASCGDVVVMELWRVEFVRMYGYL